MCSPLTIVPAPTPCVHMFANMCTCVPVCAGVCLYVHACTSVCFCVDICVATCAEVCQHVRSVHICTSMFECVSMCAHACTHGHHNVDMILSLETMRWRKTLQSNANRTARRDWNGTKPTTAWTRTAETKTANCSTWKPADNSCCKQCRALAQSQLEELDEYCG